MRLEGLAWAGAASKAALARMAADEPFAASREPQVAPRLRERRTRPRFNALTAIGLVCLAAAGVLVVALLIEVRI